MQVIPWRVDDKPVRRPQGPLPTAGGLLWSVPDEGFLDHGGRLVDLSFGDTAPADVFGPAWGLDWMLPPQGDWAFGDLYVHDLRWEHVNAAVLGPLGGGPLANYVPTTGVPTLDVMVARLLADGFPDTLATGAQSRVGAWALDLAFTELYVRAGLINPRAIHSVVGNATYEVAVRAMAHVANLPFGNLYSTWTSSLEGMSNPEKLGNIIETDPVWMLRRRDWQGFSDLVHLLAWSDRGHGGLYRHVRASPMIDIGGGAPRPVVPALVAPAGPAGVGAQPPPPPPPPPPVTTGHGGGVRAAAGLGAGGAATLAGQRAPGPQGTQHTALSPAPQVAPPAALPYQMGSFASSTADADQWRQWPTWEADLRPFAYVPGSGFPTVAGPPNADLLPGLRADLADLTMTPERFDALHRRRVVAVWAAECPAQADLASMQLGLIPWRDGDQVGRVLPVSWKKLCKSRRRRMTHPWTEDQIRSAERRGSPARPSDTPQTRDAAAADVGAGARQPVTPEPVALPGVGQAAAPGFNPRGFTWVSR